MTKIRIGIIGAMETEITELKDRMEMERTAEKAGMTFFSGRIGNTEVVLVRSGVGKVNAAACTQILIDCFEVTHILNTGLAGSLDDRIAIGDIVVSTDALQHDMDAVPFGYEAGQVPGQSVLAFPADDAFRAMAVEAVKTAAPDIAVYEGRVLSGDQFISSEDKKNEIKAKFGGLCTEMEGGAVAQTAWLNHVPFVILRSISDNAADEAGKSYMEIEAEAAAHCSAVTAAIIAEF